MATGVVYGGVYPGWVYRGSIREGSMDPAEVESGSRILILILVQPWLPTGARALKNLIINP